MPAALIPLTAGAALPLIPPVRHRAFSVGKVAASTGLGMATVAVRGARDAAEAAITGHDVTTGAAA